MPKFSFKFPRVSHIGHTVSHAKNRHSRGFKYNLHTTTVVDESGKKSKLRVPTKLLRTLKKMGITTHYRKPEKV